MIAIIGCGNANRNDDAVGVEVVSLLRDRERLQSRADVQLLNAGTDGMAVMFAARGCKTLLIIDSCRSGAAPGAIFEIPGSELESPHPPSLNLHDFRWDHALYAGQQMYRDDFPTDVTVYLIEGQNFDLGLGLSPEIGKAAKTVADSIEVRIAARPPAAAPAAAAKSQS